MPPRHPNEQEPSYCVNVEWHVLLTALKRLGFHLRRPGEIKMTFATNTNEEFTIDVSPRLNGWLGKDSVTRLAVDLGIQPINLIIEAARAQDERIEAAADAEHRARVATHGNAPPLE